MSDHQKENALRIAAYLENRLSPEEREAFKRRLSEDDELRLQYVDALMNRAGSSGGGTAEPKPEAVMAPEPEPVVMHEPEAEVTPEPEVEVMPEPEAEVTPEPEAVVTPEPLVMEGSAPEVS